MHCGAKVARDSTGAARGDPRIGFAQGHRRRAGTADLRSGVRAKQAGNIALNAAARPSAAGFHGLTCL